MKVDTSSLSMWGFLIFNVFLTFLSVEKNSHENTHNTDITSQIVLASTNNMRWLVS